MTTRSKIQHLLGSYKVLSSELYPASPSPTMCTLATEGIQYGCGHYVSVRPCHQPPAPQLCSLFPPSNVLPTKMTAEANTVYGPADTPQTAHIVPNAPVSSALIPKKSSRPKCPSTVIPAITGGRRTTPTVANNLNNDRRAQYSIHDSSITIQPVPFSIHTPRIRVTSCSMPYILLSVPTSAHENPPN
ncbi:hypothetical protein D9756_005286 [Leucocoprinus leucothites]|uniref:Uncharacterized protein n=1 Tax=Leucocoprinus leucothites TaxID=201217 RepID=A0A8H5D7N1_9AGAR|nr:hypothetical protein D9756_005286 [Leucoagaricus leucothites]